MVDSVQDIIEELDLKTIATSAVSSSAKIDDALSTENTSAKLILSILGYDPMRMENIVSSTGLTVSEVSSMLMLLELEGKIASLTGGQFQKIM